MPKFGAFILVLFLTAGCRSIPFESIGYFDLHRSDPLQVRSRFAEALAKNMQVTNSIVFQYKWQSFSALGLTQLDLENKSFQVSCFSPVGVKLFELNAQEDQVQPVFVLKELLKQKNLPQTVGEDIRRIYFDMVPANSAQIEIKKYKIIFKQIKDNAVIQHVFAGKDTRLTEKHYFVNGRKIWSVYYYAWRQHQGKIYPEEIILKNHRFGYNLIVRLKEVH